MALPTLALCLLQVPPGSRARVKKAGLRGGPSSDPVAWRKWGDDQMAAKALSKVLATHRYSSLGGKS